MNSKPFRALLLSFVCFVLVIFGATVASQPPSVTDIESTERLFGLSFDAAKRDSMLGDVESNLKKYERLRKNAISNEIPPALLFNPVPVGAKLEKGRSSFKLSPARPVTKPRNIEDVAFYTIGQLADLLRTRKVTSLQLTRMYLDRLKKYGPKLECVISLTEELALKQATRADEEIRKGRYRGPLHGIPYGAKDLLAAKGYKTTWGSVPFKDQIIGEDATVIKKLDAAGAILVAKPTRSVYSSGKVDLVRPGRICLWLTSQFRGPSLTASSIFFTLI